MQLIRELLRSKKFAAMVLGIVATLAAKIGVDAEVSREIAGIVIAYIVGQGVADHGKEAAKAKVQNDD